jgi:hypothetical protein
MLKLQKTSAILDHLEPSPPISRCERSEAASGPLTHPGPDCFVPPGAPRNDAPPRLIEIRLLGTAGLYERYR